MPPRRPAASSAALPPSRQIADPQKQRFGDTVFGDPGVAAQAWETGVVTDYSPAAATYEVKTDTGRRLQDVPRLVHMPGDQSVIPRGTTVVVTHALGVPHIIGVRQAPTAGPHIGMSPRLTEVHGVGGEDPVYALDRNDAVLRPEGVPQDVLQGDQVLTSPDGNSVAALAGGVSLLRGSPQAQVRAHGLSDLVEIICDTYRHLSALGELKIETVNGKPSLSWRAGSDQSTETGAGAENWTIRLDAGAVGDLFNLEVTTPSGQSLVRLHLGADGRLSGTGVGGIDWTSGDSGPWREDIAGNRESQVLGSLSEVVAGDTTRNTGGSSAVQVSQKASRQVGGDAVDTVAGDRTDFTGGDVHQRVNGATITDNIDDGVEATVANPARGGTPQGQAYRWINYGGGYAFVMQPEGGGSFQVLGSLPGAVQLGLDGSAVFNPITGRHEVVPVPAIFAAMKFEPFQAMMSALLTYIDTHTHSYVNVAAPAVTSPPLVPSSPIVNPTIEAIKSLRVMFGA